MSANDMLSGGVGASKSFSSQGISRCTNGAKDRGWELSCCDLSRWPRNRGMLARGRL